MFRDRVPEMSPRLTVVRGWVVLPISWRPWQRLELARSDGIATQGARWRPGALCVNIRLTALTGTPFNVHY